MSVHRPKPTKGGFIYLLHAVGTNNFKIGKALDVAARIKRLQTSSPVQIRYVYHVYVSNAAIYEMELYNRFSHLRLIGEWFTFTVDDVKNCITLMRLVETSELQKPLYPQVRRVRPKLVMDESERAERALKMKVLGCSKEKIILEVWGVSKGGSPKYKAAEAEYKRLVEESA
jgi:hypothetical protein